MAYDKIILQFSNPFPVRLKSARNKAKISQKELGIRIGMEPSSSSGRMNHYEKGRHVPDITTLKRLAEELEVPLNYFFCETEQMAELVVLFSQLDEEERTELLERVRAEKQK